MDADGMQGYSFRHCNRLMQTSNDDLTPPYKAKSLVSMPEGFQHTKTLACARPSTQNYGLCPGDSGDTVGVSLVASSTAVSGTLVDF